MNKNWKKAILAAIILLAGRNTSLLWGQSNHANSTSGNLPVLHMRQSHITSKLGFPKYLSLYRVLNGAKSVAEARALKGTISVENHTPHYSEVLWQLVYWKGECRARSLNSPPSLAGSTSIWSDIVKNPSQSTSSVSVNIHFPHPLPITGCVGLYHDGGPLVTGTVTISADLRLVYEPNHSTPNKAIDLSGEYCFGQGWGCQNATKNNQDGFAVPVKLPAGHLVELFGDISDSTFDGTPTFGPLPSGKVWGVINDFYLLRGGCGRFETKLNNKGFPRPVLLATLYNWLPADAVHLASINHQQTITSHKTSKMTIQRSVEKIFPQSLKVSAGDCIVEIYGRTGNGATDNETQMRAVLTP